MEKVINKSVEEYMMKYKGDIQSKVEMLKFNSDDEKVKKLLEFISGYKNLKLTKDDLKKPTRIKTIIPCCIRCSAKRVNGEQCTRRKSKIGEYCGTHSKVLPYGVFETKVDSNDIKQNLNVMAENIQGIMYYIDSYLNVYNTEDILDGKENPRIVAKAVKDNDVYTIPEFGLV